jgi:pilus assembly protein Flp/PilA
MRLETFCGAVRSELARFWANESGATAIEYAMIAGGVSIAIAGTVRTVGSQLNTNFYEKIAGAFQ